MHKNPEFRKLTRLSVEYNLTEHCNLSCYACDHASPLMPEKFASVDEFKRDFEALAQVFHSKQFRMVGGEPLLHPKLTEFLSVARRIGIADSIVLITNGVLLHKAPSEMWDLIDQLWVSVYPGVRRKLDVEECKKICKDKNINFDAWYVEDFNKSILNNRIENDDLIEEIFKNCRIAHETSCHTVYNGRFYKCSIAPFMGPRLALRGVAFDNRDVDGIELHNNSQLYEDLDRCLNGSIPLAACSYCLGSMGPLVKHRQLNREGRALWLQEDNSADIEAVQTLLTGK